MISNKMMLPGGRPCTPRVQLDRGFRNGETQTRSSTSTGRAGRSSLVVSRKQNWGTLAQPRKALGVNQQTCSSCVPDRLKCALPARNALRIPFRSPAKSTSAALVPLFRLQHSTVHLVPSVPAGKRDAGRTWTRRAPDASDVPRLFGLMVSETKARGFCKPYLPT